MSDSTSPKDQPKTPAEQNQTSHRLRMRVSYDGTGYRGWQLQPDQPTVQGELEKALQRITGEQIRVTGAGRTDAGVHATGQVAHFDTTAKLTPEVLERALNALLPRSVRVGGLRVAPPDFHARYSAVWKIYRYGIAGPGIPEAPLLMRTHWLRKTSLDIDLLTACCKKIRGRHDFFTFSKQENHRDNHICTIFDVHWNTGDGTLYFEIKGDRFLRSMVRMLCGAMLAVADGKAQPGEFGRALEQAERWKYAVPAPAAGLSLVEVHYLRTTAKKTNRRNRREGTDND